MMRTSEKKMAPRQYGVGLRQDGISISWRHISIGYNTYSCIKQYQ